MTSINVLTQHIELELAHRIKVNSHWQSAFNAALYSINEDDNF